MNLDALCSEFDKIADSAPASATRPPPIRAVAKGPAIPRPGGLNVRAAAPAGLGLPPMPKMAAIGTSVLRPPAMPSSMASALRPMPRPTPLPQIQQTWKHVAENSTPASRAAETVRPGSTPVKMASTASELTGLGILAVPSADELQAHVRARMAGDKSPDAASKREFLPHAAKPIAEIAGLGTLAAPYLRGHHG